MYAIAFILPYYAVAVFPGRIVAAFPLLFSLALVAQVQISSTIRKYVYTCTQKNICMYNSESQF